ncbi:hypothetical protein Acsp07_30360 [Actinomycetospora sp. NBRC 106378]|nr:hypothetical protein Acsp07_30360 [Actinomycetospora sp. NBRC 106378]
MLSSPASAGDRRRHTPASYLIDRLVPILLGRRFHTDRLEAFLHVDDPTGTSPDGHGGVGSQDWSCLRDPLAADAPPSHTRTTAARCGREVPTPP